MARFNTSAAVISLDWAKTLIDKAIEYGYNVRLDAGHIGTRWEGVWHLNIEKYHVAIPSSIVEALSAYLEARGVH